MWVVVDWPEGGIRVSEGRHGEHLLYTSTVFFGELASVQKYWSINGGSNNIHQSYIVLISMTKYRTKMDKQKIP
jgi:hypothetical protein